MLTVEEPRGTHINVQGMELALWEWGPGGSPHKVVMLHGWLDHSRAWDLVATWLRAARPDLHLIAYDHRGHGRSGWAPPGAYYHFMDYLADLHGVLKWLGEGPVALVGHSMGGNVASYYAGAMPSRVQRLCVLESMMVPETEWSHSGERIAQWLGEPPDEVRARARVFPHLGEIARRLALTMPHASPLVLEHLAPHAALEVEGGWSWRFDPLHRTRAPYPFLSPLARQLWSNIPCPTLLLEGSESLLPRELMDERYQLIPHHKVQVIPDAGHAMHVENPIAVAHALLEWLG